LLLLDADPTADINNTIKVRRVMRAGRWIPYTPSYLTTT